MMFAWLVFFMATAVAEETLSVKFQLNVFPFTDVTSVHLGGSFNDYSTTSHPMTYDPEKNVYHLAVDLQEGVEYTYKYIVDGTLEKLNTEDECVDDTIVDGARKLTVPELSQFSISSYSLDPVVWESCSEVSRKARVTLQVDKSNYYGDELLAVNAPGGAAFRTSR